MKTDFPYYVPTGGQQKLVEQLEAQGLEFPVGELTGITGEAGFNDFIGKTIQHLKDIFDETVHGLERLHYYTRTIGPFMPYPSTPKTDDTQH